MNIKDHLVVHLPQRIIIFPFHNYLDSFLTRIVNKYTEWDLLKNKKITGREKYFKFFVEKEISDIIFDIRIVYQNYNIKILTVSKNYTIPDIFDNYIDNKEFVIKSIYKIFKKNCNTYFYDNIPDIFNFNTSGRFYKGLKCVDLTGEETEFIIKITKKWTSM